MLHKDLQLKGFKIVADAENSETLKRFSTEKLPKNLHSTRLGKTRE